MSCFDTGAIAAYSLEELRKSNILLKTQIGLYKKFSIAAIVISGISVLIAIAALAISLNS